MLVADQGIVLHYITYSESSLIIKVLTKEKGVISLLKKGARRTASKGAKSKFPALSLVSVEYYFSEKGTYTPPSPSSSENPLSRYTTRSTNQQP